MTLSRSITLALWETLLLSDRFRSRLASPLVLIELGREERGRGRVKRILLQFHELTASFHNRHQVCTLDLKEVLERSAVAY